jgi:hypothetical protein
MLSGYEVRVPEMAFGEAIGTAKPEARVKLIETCRGLVASGSGFTAVHWLMDRHIKRFHDYPRWYSWRNVQSRFFDLEEEMLSGNYYTDAALVGEQAAEMLRVQDGYEQCFLKSERMTALPNSFADGLAECRVKGGSFWNTARGLYCAAFRPQNGIMIAPKRVSPGMLLHAEGYSLVLGTVKTGSEGLRVLQTWAADPSPEVIFLGASSRRFALLRHAPSPYA